MDFLIFIIVIGFVALLLYSLFTMGKLFAESPFGFIMSLIGLGFLFSLGNDFDDDCEI